MGLLARTNPLATRESVIRHAKIFGVLTVVVYCGICVWYPAWREFWWLKLPVAVVFGAGLGALMEWQLNDNPDIYEVVHRVQKDFSIEIPEAEWKGIETVGDLLQCVLRASDAKTGGQSFASAAAKEALFEWIRTTLVNCLGVDPDEVEEQSRFGADLGVVTWSDVNLEKGEEEPAAT